jgi:hypothetical protein
MQTVRSDVARAFTAHRPQADRCGAVSDRQPPAAATPGAPCATARADELAERRAGSGTRPTGKWRTPAVRVTVASRCHKCPASFRARTQRSVSRRFRSQHRGLEHPGRPRRVVGAGARLQESGIDESFFRLHTLAVAGGRVSAAPGQVMSGQAAGEPAELRRSGIAMPPRLCHQLPAERLCRSVTACRARRTASAS